MLALYLLLPKVVDTEQTLKYISHASYRLLLAACVLEVAALAGYANLFRYILRVLDVRLRLHEAWAITVSGLAVSHILSAGGVGGWVVTYNALMKYKVPHGIIFVAIAAQQFFNYIVLWLFFAMAMVYLIVTRGGGSIIGYLLGISLIVGVLAITSYGAYLYKRPGQLHRRAHGAARLANRALRREVLHERPHRRLDREPPDRHAPHDAAPRRGGRHAPAGLRVLALRHGLPVVHVPGVRGGPQHRLPAGGLRGRVLGGDRRATPGGMGAIGGHHDRAVRELRRALRGRRRRGARVPDQSTSGCRSRRVRGLRDACDPGPQARSREGEVEEAAGERPEELGELDAQTQTQRAPASAKGPLSTQEASYLPGCEP